MQRSDAELAKGKGALINPSVKDIQVVDLLTAPDLSATPGDILKPLALWPMPALEAATRFRVQVASDEAFSQIVRDMVVTSASADLSNLPNGDWFARVRGIDASGIEGYDSVKAVQVLQLPRRWSISQDRLDAVAGRHVLQFSPTGLDNSHTIVAEVTSGQPPYKRIAEVTAQGSRSRIFMDLGLLDPGAPMQLDLTVTQVDGEQVIPLIYRFAALGSWDQAEGSLQLLTPDKP